MDTRNHIPVQGFTMVELMIVVAIVGITVAIATPQLTRFMDFKHLKGAGNTLVADLQLARSEAIQNNKEVRIYFSTGTTWCYGFDDTVTANLCNCSTANITYCTLGGVQKAMTATPFARVQMDSASFNGQSHVAFNPQRATASESDGTLRNGTVTFSSTRSGGSIQVQVNILGRPLMCSPSGSSYVSGAPQC
ncbi:MAG: GspH/FimT family pseudopilin [Magnetococcales bacterium]|nr:GspH/FimT family pseudopilin [Magnetococcales bacterium]MBF0151751.1 GspH/FimT family pseudopilin [Magnetococcales bacterium]MBF0173278.1 GspH/FimT family pseudopilin [Magnetococcales bacterium]MBF0346991.1 GspH/FimT family pseudopilin [Magnetococcales bacterium]MBF0631311.1 GspH/FimT family pseudopilin [Magnetococcales bacterium]